MASMQESIESIEVHRGLRFYVSIVVWIYGLGSRRSEVVYHNANHTRSSSEAVDDT